MALIEWNENLNVGVEEINTQHKKLIALINRLHDEMSQGKGRYIIKEVLHELINYTLTHFVTEEKLMESREYPRGLQHREAHKRLTKKVSDIQEKYRENDFTVSQQVLSLLHEWLVQHIQKTDMDYARHFAGKVCAR
jgi:hemerythrin-like metal-binding protein